jgi:ketosteroid isomerase-like protein
MTATDNAELVRRGYEAFNRGDFEGVLALFDPELRINVLPETMMAQTFHGHEGFLRLMAENAEMFESYRNHPEEVIELGDDHIVVIVRSEARGRLSGAEVEGRLVHLWTLRDGRVIRFEAFPTTEEARRAAETG